MKFTDKDIYENFQIVKNLPLVHKLMKKIEKLQRKNKELKQVVKILTKVECPKPKLEKTQTIYSDVEIKQEPHDNDIIEIIEEPNIEFKVIDLDEEEDDNGREFPDIEEEEEQVIRSRYHPFGVISQEEAEKEQEDAFQKHDAALQKIIDEEEEVEENKDAALEEAYKTIRFLKGKINEVNLSNLSFCLVIYY